MGSQSWSKQLFGSLFIRMVFITTVALATFLLVFFGAFRSALFFPGSMESLANPVSKLVTSLEAAPPSDEEAILELFASPTRLALVRGAFPDSAAPNEAYRKGLLAGTSDAGEVLAKRELRFRYFPGAQAKRELSPAEREAFPFVTALEISVELNDGRVLAVLFSPAAIMVDRPGFIGMLLMIAALGIGVSAAISIRTLLKPLKDLETAADRFGATFDPEPVQERGSEEIRRLARALNRTQDQVRDLINERARMISALSHDIFTGLTRLRLRVEQLTTDERPAFADDIDQMEVLIDDMLTYAKSGDNNRPLELVELRGFVADYAQDAPSNISFETLGDDREFTIAGDPKVLSRILNNLVDNAIKYGTDVSIVCEQTVKGFAIHIDDRGPGIPAGELIKVVEPFYRLETSRNRSTGGSGMGLGIARSLVEAQGGSLSLSNRQPNGLRATVFFPKKIEIAH